MRIFELSVVSGNLANEDTPGYRGRPLKRACVAEAVFPVKGFQKGIELFLIEWKMA
jgi:hypothetical protein